MAAPEPTPEEQALADGEISSSRPLSSEKLTFKTATNRVWLMDVEGAGQVIGQRARRPDHPEPFLAKMEQGLLDTHGHDTDSALRAEYAARELAKMIGSDYAQMVVPVVPRQIDAGEGNGRETMLLSPRREGIEMKTYKVKSVEQAMEQIPENDQVEFVRQAKKAALLDMAIGAQDRHAGNYMWDPKSRQLHLYDHEFSFPKEGFQPEIGSSHFAQWRDGQSLDDGEVGDLEAMRSPEVRQRMRELIGPEREQAMAQRVERAIELRQVIAPDFTRVHQEVKAGVHLNPSGRPTLESIDSPGEVVPAAMDEEGPALRR